MRYMGSKAKFAKDIAPFLATDFCYIEPFAGGMNMMSARPFGSERRIANDVNEPLIDMFQALQNGWRPKEHYTKEEYELAENSTRQSSESRSGVYRFSLFVQR